MTTGLIGTSTVAFNTVHNNNVGGVTRITVDGSTLSYTCPASGVRYAVVNIAAAVALGNLPVPGADGYDPQVSAGMLKMRQRTGDAQHRYSVVLAPGQTWNGKASSTVLVSAFSNINADTYAELTASALEVV